MIQQKRNTFRQERTWTRQQNQSSHDGLEGFNQTSSFSLERLSKHTVLNSRRRICAAALLTWAATGYKQRGGLTRRRPCWCSQTVRDNDWLRLQRSSQTLNHKVGVENVTDGCLQSINVRICLHFLFQMRLIFWLFVAWSHWTSNKWHKNKIHVENKASYFPVGPIFTKCCDMNLVTC